MTTLYEVQIGQRFSFQVYPTAIIGNAFADVVMEGIISADIARAYNFDIYSMHSNVYPTLPAGTPNDPTQYSYIMVKMANGERQIVGIPWIRQDSITISTGGTIQLIFSNKTALDLERIQAALSANGQMPDVVNWV